VGLLTTTDKEASLSGADEFLPAELDIGERKTLRTLRAFGAIGSVLLAIGSVGAGAAPVVDPALTVPVLGELTHLPALALAVAVAGLGMLIIGWLLLGRFVTPGRARTAGGKDLRTTLLLWVAPLAVIPPLFSRDVYSYLAQGAITHRGLDPYTVGPAAALGPAHALTANVSTYWRGTPAPYGPLALRLGDWIAGLTRENVVAGILLHRLVALAGFGLVVWALPRLARRFGVEPSAALWLGAANPLVLFHLVAGAHNDSLAIGLMMAGFALGVSRLPVGGAKVPGEFLYAGLGAAVITLGVAVKLNAVLALPFLVVMVAARWGGRWRDLLRAAAPMIAVFAAVLVGASLGSGLGFGWLGAFSTPGLVRSWISPTSELGQVSGMLVKALGFGDHTTGLVEVFGLAGYAVGVVVTLRFLVLGLRGRRSLMIGLALSLGTVMVLHVALQPWYLLWAIVPLAAAAGAPRARVAAIAASAVVSLVVFPTGATFAGKIGVAAFGYLGGIAVIAVAMLILRRLAPMALDRPFQALTRPV
jgi:alpha-1,6-mannosyltransferase